MDFFFRFQFYFIWSRYENLVEKDTKLVEEKTAQSETQETIDTPNTPNTPNTPKKSSSLVKKIKTVVLNQNPLLCYDLFDERVEWVFYFVFSFLEKDWSCFSQIEKFMGEVQKQ